MSTTAPALDSNVAITFLQTGTSQIKMAMYTQPATRSIMLRKLSLFTSSAWTDPLPVGAFLIQHPTGPYLFDAGESICRTNPGYLPAWTKPMQTLTKPCIEPKDSIVEQLRQHGVDPKDLKGVVLSHLHGDHAGGLEQLLAEAPDVPVYVGKTHWDAWGNSPFNATIQGCAPHHWPKSFPPRTLEAKDVPVGPWKQSYPVTEDGRIVAVDTPGHVPGHISLVVRSANGDGTETTFLLAGDATYNIDLLDAEEVDGVNDDPIRALESLRTIREFAKQEKVVVLPSHDSRTTRFLAERTVYTPKSLA